METTFTIHYFTSEGYGEFSLTGEGVTADEALQFFIAEGGTEDSIEEILKED